MYVENGWRRLLHQGARGEAAKSKEIAGCEPVFGGEGFVGAPGTVISNIVAFFSGGGERADSRGRIL